MKKNIFYILAISLFIVSCGPKINSAQQESLEKLTLQVDSITEKINEIDSLQLTQLTLDFAERKRFIQYEMVDTLKPEIIFKLDAFMQLRKPMGFIMGEYTTIKTEANILQKQMVDLNHDVSNRLVEEKQFERYYTLENDNYGELSMAANQLFRAVEGGTKSYNEMVVEIDSIISAHKARLNE